MKRLKKYFIGILICLFFMGSIVFVGCTNKKESSSLDSSSSSSLENSSTDEEEGGEQSPPETVVPIAKVVLDMSLEKDREYFCLGKAEDDKLSSIYGVTNGTLTAYTDDTYGNVLQVSVDSTTTVTQIGFCVGEESLWEEKCKECKTVVLYVYNPMKTVFGPYLRITTGDGNEVMQIKNAWKGAIFLKYGWNRLEIPLTEFYKTVESGKDFYIILDSPLGKKYENVSGNILISNIYTCNEEGISFLNTMATANVEKLLGELDETVGLVELTKAKNAYNALVETDKNNITQLAKETMYNAEIRLVVNELNERITALENVNNMENSEIENRILTMEEEYAFLSEQAQLQVNRVGIVAYKEDYFQKVVNAMPPVETTDYEEIQQAIARIERVLGTFFKEDQIKHQTLIGRVAGYTENLISELPSLEKDRSVWSDDITMRITHINRLCDKLDGQTDKVANYEEFSSYVNAYHAIPILLANRKILSDHNNSTLRGTFTDTEITKPLGASASVIKVTTSTGGYPSLPFFYANTLAGEDYSWAKTPLIHNIDNIAYYHIYVSVWVKADEEITLSFFTMNNAWVYRRQNYTLQEGEDWRLLIVKLNAGHALESADTGYGYIAGMRTIDANNTAVAGSFYMCDMRLWAVDPTAYLENELEYIQANMAVNIQKCEQLIDSLPAIDTLNGRTAEIDAKLAEIDTACSLLTDLASVTNYATYTEFVAAYNQLPALVWDASNASDLAMFSLESRNTATDDNYSQYAGGTISTSTDATYGTVMDINSLAWNVHFAKIDMMEGYHTIKDGVNDISAGVLEWTNRLNGYDKVVFYVYNPADIDLELRFVDAAGFTSVKGSERTLAAKQWTKIVYEKADFLNHIKFSSSTYLAIRNSGNWENKSENLKGLSIKFTSFYGYTAEEYETAFPNA